MLMNFGLSSLFWKRGASDDLLKSSCRRWGVVRSMDAKEQTVKVQWETIPITKADNLAEDSKEETVSSYELVEHPGFSYCFGDIVCRATQKQYGHQADTDQAKSKAGLNVDVSLKGKSFTNAQNEFRNKCYLSCIGTITGFMGGSLEVKWATGSTTKVAPYEIFRIDKCEGSTATSVSSEANVVELTEEMTKRENRSSSQKEKASIFQSLAVTSQAGAVSSVHISKDENESGLLIENEILQACDLCNQFKQFDVMADCSDHHFLDTCKGLPLSQVERSWVKKVQQEWSILEKNLPDTIYIRAFEERMNLLRAAIIGAPGTPYHDGLFFFDIFFPPQRCPGYRRHYHFEALVEEHFSRRSQYLLLACKAYLEGAPVGWAFGCGKTEHESEKGTSTGFKIMLAKLLPKLVEAFSAKGIDCRPLY
ncbi:putative Ubiquitin conjugating enzyme [Quillaja saponaria]|uniref:Ubiquitin conjugating enzyme n=1 Tax=Quillaja saponaria TaxID=32244 RepID=A0AAD7KW95_QUISA|nr:putative Ubiquitin conjugating enzyme [Quillaja saponaria]